MKHPAACMLFLLAAASLAASAAAAARPLPAGAPGVSRRVLTQLPSGLGPAATTTYSVEWDLAFVPYPRVEARCGDLMTFRWEGREAQTVGAMYGTSSSAALAECSKAEPLTEAATSGEHTEELLTPGTVFFVEPTNCGRGQILVVNVACEEAAGMAVLGPQQDDAAAEAAAAQAPGAAPAPAA